MVFVGLFFFPPFETRLFGEPPGLDQTAEALTSTQTVEVVHDVHD